MGAKDYNKKIDVEFAIQDFEYKCEFGAFLEI